jgi:hypothetical protein
MPSPTPPGTDPSWGLVSYEDPATGEILHVTTEVVDYGKTNHKDPLTPAHREARTQAQAEQFVRMYCVGVG